MKENRSLANFGWPFVHRAGLSRQQNLSTSEHVLSMLMRLRKRNGSNYVYGRSYGVQNTEEVHHRSSSPRSGRPLLGLVAVPTIGKREPCIPMLEFRPTL